MNWLRWYHGTVNDPKWRAIAKTTGQPVHVIVSIWAATLENASESPTRGTLENWSSEDVGIMLDLTGETVETVCNAMKRRGLFHANSCTLTAWEKRNPKRERDDPSTERVQRFRELKRQVTPSNATKRLDKRRVEEKREEEGKGIGETKSADAALLVSYGEFKRAQMTLEQHAKLLAEMDGSLDSYICDFDRWVNEAPDAKHNGVRRRDRHAYESISAWYRRDVKEGKVKKPKTLERKAVY